MFVLTSCRISEYNVPAILPNQCAVYSLLLSTGTNLVRPRHYNPPNENNANSCLCSSVVYSLLSACGVCQVDKPIAEANPSPKCVHLPPSADNLVIYFFVLSCFAFVWYH